MLKKILLAASAVLLPSLAHAEYWGDLPFNDGTVYRTFDTFDTDGILVTLTSGGIEFYEDDNTTPITLAETFTVDRFGTGKHVVAIDTDNAAFEAGKHYSAKIIAGATADGVAVGGVEVAWFTVGAYATAPANFDSLSVDGDGRVDVIKIAGTTQTARDIGASVLLSSGTGTGQLDFSSGLLAWNPAWDAEAQSEATDALNAYDPPTNAEMEARTVTAATYATAANLATVDTVVDAIKVVTDLFNSAQAEPTGVPAANETPLEKIGRLFMVMRNGMEITADSKSIKDDAGNVEWVKPLADDDTTFTEGEAEAP